MIEVVVVDDNPIVRAALRGFLDGADGVRVVAEAGDGAQALAVVRRTRPTVTLLDYRMPIMDGLSVLAELGRMTTVLVLTSDADPVLVASMLRQGARGYLVHGEFDPPELLRAVRAAAEGRGWLSPVAAAAATSALRDESARDAADRDRRDQWQRARARYGLTDRERDVLELLSEGMSNASIARRLVLTEKTVKNHLNHIFAKLAVTNRTEAVLRWTGRDP